MPLYRTHLFVVSNRSGAPAMGFSSLCAQAPRSYRRPISSPTIGLSSLYVTTRRLFCRSSSLPTLELTSLNATARRFDRRLSSAATIEYSFLFAQARHLCRRHSGSKTFDAISPINCRRHKDAEHLASILVRRWIDSKNLAACPACIDILVNCNQCAFIFNNFSLR